jgi:hypothetical protein
MIVLAAVMLVAIAAAAEPVNHAAPDGVAARVFISGTAMFVTTDGRAFVIASTAPLGTWEEVFPNWPVPFGQVIRIESYFIMAQDGSVWGNSSSNLNGTWTQIPVLPVEPPVQSQGTSLGGVKGLFR